MHRPEAHVTKRMTQARDQRRHVGQAIGSCPQQSHRDRAIMQSLLMADAAVDGDEHIIVANHGVEQIPVGQACPTDIHGGCNVDPVK
jgi:hypothetical protein